MPARSPTDLSAPIAAAIAPAAPRLARLLLAALLAALLTASSTSCHRQHDADGEQHEAPHVRVIPIERASFTRTFQGLGVVQPLPDHVELVSAAQEGRVAELLVQHGARVRAGDALVRLDARLAEQSLDEKRAEREEKSASLELLKAPPREPERRAAELESARARVAVDLARAALERLEPLHRRQEVSSQQLFEARQKLAEAELALQGADARRDIIVQGPRPEAVREGEAQLARAEATEKSAATRLALLTATASRDGFIDRIHCRPGQFVSAGTLLVELVDDSAVIVEVAVPPREAGGLSPGQAARVGEAAIAGAPAGKRPLDGEVTFVGLQASPSTGSIPLHVRVENAGHALRLGVFVSIEVVTATIPEALAAPLEALDRTRTPPTLALVRDGKAAFVRPRLGATREGRVEVSLEGLQEGDLAIVEGWEELEEGAEVEAEPEAKIEPPAEVEPSTQVGPSTREAAETKPPSP